MTAPDRPVCGHSLLELDPDLGLQLAPERLDAARRELRARVRDVPPGHWTPSRPCLAPAPAIGVLIVSGAAVREISLRDAPSAELLGPGDVIRTWREQDYPGALDPPARWSALSGLVVASLDADLGTRLAHFPEVMTIVLDRIESRARRLAVTQAISQLTGVDLRLQALFMHLAERWGRVTPQGITIPLALSHRLLGSLIGARRPTVSSALADLARQRRLVRRPDGSWLLPNRRPDNTLDNVLTPAEDPLALEAMLA